MAEMTIRRFGVISVAKMYGLLMFIVRADLRRDLRVVPHHLWSGDVGDLGRAA